MSNRLGMAVIVGAYCSPPNAAVAASVLASCVSCAACLRWRCTCEVCKYMYIVAMKELHCREIRIRTSDGAFRVFYVVESATDVYVLHAFQKKTQKTASKEIEKGKARYKLIP